MSDRRRQLRPRDPKTGRLSRITAAAPRLVLPPRAVRQAKLDNVALVTGNLLPFKAHYQRIANALPAGDVLIVLPPTDTRLRKTLSAVVDLFRAKGQRVTTVSAEQLG
jgi:hypothetical protein